MIALALVLAVAGPIDPATAKQRAGAILAAPRYSFCHDARYPLTDDEGAWCSVAPRPNPRCPRFHEACDAPRASFDLDGPRRLQHSRDGDGDAREAEDRDKNTQPGGNSKSSEVGRRADPRRRVARDDADEPVLPDMSGLAQVLFWTVLGLGVVAILIAIFRNTLARRPDDLADSTPVPEDIPGQPAIARDDAALVRDVTAMLERARTAARAGDFPAAIRAAHAALLYRLDHDGLIRVDASRTNGDHLRDLRDKPELRAEVRDVVRDVEQIQFGSAPASASLFERVFARVSAIATRTGALGLLLVLLVGCPLGGYQAPWDLSPSGSGAVIELAGKHDIQVRYRDRRLEALEVALDDDEDKPGTLVLLADTDDPTPEVWQHVLDWARKGRHLVIAGGPLPPGYGLRYETAADIGPDLALAPDVTDLPGLDGGPNLRFVAPDRHTVTSDDFRATPLVLREDGSTYALRIEIGLGAVTVLADERVLTNGGLMLADNPALAVSLLAVADGPVELVDGLLSFGTDSPAEAMQALHLTPVILQLLALVLALYLWRGVRFGRPRDPPAHARRRFAEHIEALGLQYARARAGRHAARQYATWALERLRDRTSGQGGLYGAAQTIAARTGDDETRVFETLVEAGSLREGAADQSLAGRSRAEAGGRDELKLMQELARLYRASGGRR